MHWNSDSFPSSLKMWDIGGYWTGNALPIIIIVTLFVGSKREGNKKEVREAWDKVLANFPGYFEGGKDLGNLIFF
jgi:hypothetical protein